MKVDETTFQERQELATRVGKLFPGFIPAWDFDYIYTPKDKSDLVVVIRFTKFGGAEGWTLMYYSSSPPWDRQLFTSVIEAAPNLEDLIPHWVGLKLEFGI